MMLAARWPWWGKGAGSRGCLTSSRALGRRLKGRKCFVAGTLVLAASGLMPIESVAVGDEVWAWDESTGTTRLQEVVRLFESETDELVRVTVGFFPKHVEGVRVLSVAIPD